MHSKSKSSTGATDNPEALLLQLITGAWASQIIYVAAKLGLPDSIHEGNNDIQKLSKSLHVKKNELFRFLGALKMLGIINDQTNITLTETGDLLRRNRATSLHAFALFCGADWHKETWDQLLQRLTIDTPIFDHLKGMPLFDYLKGKPLDRHVFDDAMDSLSSLWGPAVAEELDLSNVKSIIDVGGGSGIFLAEILRKTPSVNGYLLDLPEAILRAKQTRFLHDLVSSNRCKLLGNSFFEKFPVKADAVIMKSVLHDWPDEEALTILKNSRNAMPNNGKLFIIEQILDPHRGIQLAQLTDIEMMLFSNGKERTTDEFTYLILQAGFSINAILPTHSPFSILQASAV